MSFMLMKTERKKNREKSIKFINRHTFMKNSNYEDDIYKYICLNKLSISYYM